MSIGLQPHVKAIDERGKPQRLATRVITVAGEAGESWQIGHREGKRITNSSLYLGLQICEGLFNS